MLILVSKFMLEMRCDETGNTALHQSHSDTYPYHPIFYDTCRHIAVLHCLCHKQFKCLILVITRIRSHATSYGTAATHTDRPPTQVTSLSFISWISLRSRVSY